MPRKGIPPSQPDLSGPIPDAYRKFASLIGAAIVALGLLGLLGWLGMPLLASIRPSYVPMAPLTAIVFACLGGLLLVHSMALLQGPAGKFAAAFSVLLFAYVLSELLNDPWLGLSVPSLEEWLFPDPPMLGAIQTARMSPATEVFFLLSGAVVPMLYLRKRKRKREKLFGDLAGGLGLLVAVAGAVFILGYLHETPLLYGTSIIPMAATTALGFLLLGTGQVLAVGPGSLPLRPFVGSSARPRLLRVFVSTTVGVVVTIDLLHVYARGIFFEGDAYLSGVSTAAFIVVAGALIARVAFKVGEDMDRSEGVRKRAEEALKESKALTDSVVDNIPLMVFLKEATDLRFVLFNRAGEELLGHDRKELLGKNNLDLFPPEQAAHFMAKDREVLDGEPGILDIPEESITTARKGVRLLHTRKVCLRGADGATKYLLGISEDITERKRSEEHVARLHQQNELILDSVEEGILGLDLQGRHTFVNSAAARMLGYEVDELLGRHSHSTWHHTKPDGSPYPVEECQIYAAYRNGTVHHVSTEVFWSKEGTSFPVEYSSTPILEQGRLSGAVVVFVDITERKRAEEEKLSLERQVQQAQKMESLGVLAGGIAHDFNNILMAVQGHAELALDGIPPTSPARVNLAEITTATGRAADLCRQMLAYAGKASFALERVGLRDLVEEMADLLKTSISKKAILTLNLERGVPPIQADPSQIRQIVMNLIINASEAIGDRCGTITVAVGTTRCDAEYLQKTELHDDLLPGQYVHLEVTDTGSGMDAETQARIFEPFFTTKFTGRGLGLAAVLGIIRAYKGALKVYSEPGKGTMFKVLFPALTDGEDATRFPESSPLSDWRGKGTILLVDDEESLLTLGTRMLEHLGFTVLTAADGQKAVNLYRERGNEIDVVLMDLTMPIMDGAMAFDEMRLLNPDARVVLASGYAEDDVSSRFKEQKPAGIIQKPYTLAKLRELLSGLLPKRPAGEG